MLVTFSSDYGTADEFVGVCHAVIVRIAPEARVVDLAHGIRGIRQASAALAQSVAYTGADVHLAIVDPGVGTQRRGVAVVAADGSVFVGPDNGLLPPAADALGGVTAAFELVDPAYRLEGVSATFHGRDVFAPAAAHLAAGVLPSSFGPGVDDLVRLPPPSVEVTAGRLRSDVLRAEGFGNVQLAATADDLVRADLGAGARIGRHQAVVGTTFADARPGRLVVFIDASGHVSVAVNGGSAADLLGHPTALDIERA